MKAFFSNTLLTLVIDKSKNLIDAVKGDKSNGYAAGANDGVSTLSKRSKETFAKDIISTDYEALTSAVRSESRKNDSSARPKTPDIETSAALTRRARGLLALGDISAARLLLERAANERDATAAFLLAQTYDPAVVGVNDTRSVVPDPALARDWYGKAASLGSVSAQQHLATHQK